MNPALNYLVIGTVVLLLVAYFGAVAYITYRVLRYGERNYGGEAT